MLFGFQKLVYVLESEVYIHCCLVGVSYGLENVVRSGSRLTRSLFLENLLDSKSIELSCLDLVQAEFSTRGIYYLDLVLPFSNPKRRAKTLQS